MTSKLFVAEATQNSTLYETAWLFSCQFNEIFSLKLVVWPNIVRLAETLGSYTNVPSPALSMASLEIKSVLDPVSNLPLTGNHIPILLRPHSQGAPRASFCGCDSEDASTSTMRLIVPLKSVEFSAGLLKSGSCDCPFCCCVTPS